MATITTLGVVVAAIISTAGKRLRRQSTSNPPSQITTGSNSTNVANVRGNVTIGTAQHPLNIPTFAGGDPDIGATRRLDHSKAVGEFTDFLESHRGRVVHLNVAVSRDFSAVFQPQLHDPRRTLVVSPSPCKTPDNFLPCMGYGLKIRGDEYELGWYRGHHVLNGYFVIGENVEHHQGRWFALRAVPPADVLLQVQR